MRQAAPMTLHFLRNAARGFRKLPSGLQNLAEKINMVPIFSKYFAGMSKAYERICQLNG
jgi:hypothetical protein